MMSGGEVSVGEVEQFLVAEVYVPALGLLPLIGVVGVQAGQYLLESLGAVRDNVEIQLPMLQEIGAGRIDQDPHGNDLGHVCETLQDFSEGG